jgi:hypothetical protein
MKNLIYTKAIAGNSILLILFLLLFSNYSKGQVDAYEMENTGYFTNPVETPEGIVVTDNFCSKIYLINGQSIEELVSAPGCGRYFTLSPDKQYIGFKMIHPDGKQSPAIIDLQTRRVKELYEPVVLCSQVSFSANGKIAFNIEKALCVIDNDKIISYQIGQYTNTPAISPDGNYVAFDIDQKSLQILNLSTRTINQIGDNTAIFPRWSPDGQKLVFSDLKGRLKIWDKKTTELTEIDKGINPCWSDDSRYILYQKTEEENLQLKGSDIYQCRFDGKEITNLTKTPDIFEMSASWSKKNTFTYHTYNKRQICRSKLDKTRSGITLSTEIVNDSFKPNPQKFDTDNFTVHKTRKINKLTKEVPYIHQVYDTPNWHNGYASCAPTTAVMAFAYFNRLPKWPTKIKKEGYAEHINDYSSYIADKYRYNNYFFSAYSSSRVSWGGYAHMWITYGSPFNGGMKSYLTLHGIECGNVVEEAACTFDKTKTEIDNGYPQPICNYLTASGHVTLAVGYSSDFHYVIFMDCYGNKNSYSYPSIDGRNVIYDWPGYNNGYQNLGGDYNIIPWTYLAHTSEPLYNDTIIDDTYYNQGFYINNSQNTAKMEYYHCEKAGYNNLVWWTYTDTTKKDVCFVTWTPTLPANANYEVSVYIPDLATATNAKYKIFHANGSDSVIIDQTKFKNTWVSLGKYSFLQGKAGYVYLGDAAPTKSQILTFDAIKWEKVQNSLTVISTNITCKGASDGTAKAIINNGKEPYTYEWNTIPVQTTNSIKGLKPGNYSVTVKDKNNTVYNGLATILEAEQTLSLSAIQINPTLKNLPDGEITTKITGGVSPYIYNWSPAVSTASFANNLAAEKYTVGVTDANGCSQKKVVELINPLVNRPIELKAINIDYDKATLTWESIAGAERYLIQFRPFNQSYWKPYTSTTTTLEMTNLEEFREYYFKVAAANSLDTSEYTFGTFKTLHKTSSTECFGKFYDAGGSSLNYPNNDDYTFTIAPKNAKKIKVTFVYFETEKSYDYLYAYDGQNTSAPVINRYHGDSKTSGSLIPDTVVSTGGSLTFRFKSDKATNDYGWYANWEAIGGECGGTGIDDVTNNIDFEIFTTGQTIHIKSILSNIENMQVEIFNLLGERVDVRYYKRFSNEIIESGLKEGVYLVKISSKNIVFSRKISIN